MDNQKIGVIGAGSWGIALAYLLANNGHDVTVWSRSEATVEKLKNYHGNEDKLPGVKLPESVVYTSDIKTAVENKDLLVLVVPSAHLRVTVKLMKPFITSDMTISVSSSIPFVQLTIICLCSSSPVIKGFISFTVTRRCADGTTKTKRSLFSTAVFMSEV